MAKSKKSKARAPQVEPAHRVLDMLAAQTVGMSYADLLDLAVELKWIFRPASMDIQVIGGLPQRDALARDWAVALHSFASERIAAKAC